MTLDLRDPASIAAWFKAAPKRHAQFLRWALRQPSYARFHAYVALTRTRRFAVVCA